MSNRPFHELTERIRSKVADSNMGFTPPDVDAAQRTTDALITKLAMLLEFDPKDSDAKILSDELRSALEPSARSSRDDLRGALMAVRQQYANCYNAYLRIKDIERSAHRNERRSQTRAFLFRMLTTLGVGACIIIIYGVADHYGLSLPLSRPMSVIQR